MYFSEIGSLCDETESKFDNRAINLLQIEKEMSDEDFGNQPPSKWYFLHSVLESIASQMLYYAFNFFCSDYYTDRYNICTQTTNFDEELASYKNSQIIIEDKPKKEMKRLKFKLIIDSSDESYEETSNLSQSKLKWWVYSGYTLYTMMIYQALFIKNSSAVKSKKLAIRLSN